MALTSYMRPIDHARLQHGRRLAGGRHARLSLPWSTSATGILLVLWLLALIPTLDWADLRRELADAGRRPAGAAGRARRRRHGLGRRQLAERWGGVASFARLLVIPLLFVQFRRSERGFRVFGGFSRFLRRAARRITLVHPANPSKLEAVFVKNGATQSGEFVLCIFGMLLSRSRVARTAALVAGRRLRRGDARHAGQYVLRRYRAHRAGHRADITGRCSQPSN